MSNRPEPNDEDALAAEGYRLYSREAVEFAEMSLPAVTEALRHATLDAYAEWSGDLEHQEALQELNKIAEDANWL